MRRSSFIVLLFTFIGSLFSNDLKIGYIDSQKILSELEEVRAVQIELEKKQRPKLEKIEKEKSESPYLSYQFYIFRFY